MADEESGNLQNGAIPPRPRPPAGQQHSSTNNNNQALLRQQAHAIAPQQPPPQQQQQFHPHHPSVPSQQNRYGSLQPNHHRLNNNNNNPQNHAPAAGMQPLLDPSSSSSHLMIANEHTVENDNNNNNNPSSGWSEVTVLAGQPPSARSLHSAAVIHGVMYVFGGFDGEQRVNSFHAYNFAEKRWSPVLPSANSGPPPSPRDRHVSVAYGNSFLVHGGFDGTARDAGLFAFDFGTMMWREIVATQGRPPSARHSHSAVVYLNSLYIFGGYSGSYMSDLHEFDFSLSRWTPVAASGRRPRARYRATCCVHRNYLLLYGGHDGTRHLSDTFVFNFENQTWSALITEGIVPTPRDSHISVMHDNSMFVFGGSSGNAMNDMHELQLSASNSVGELVGRWRPTRPNAVDQPKHRFCHSAVVWNDCLYVFGGYDGAERLSSFEKFDFVVYDLSFEVPPSTIIHDLRSLVNNEMLSDVTFVVEGQPVYAHKLMLMRCPYFEALFLGKMRESQMDTIHIEQVRYNIFVSILEYLYTDQIAITFNNAMELFEAADLFGVERLKTMCEKKMLQSITPENASLIFHAADIHCAVALREKAKKYILTHFEDISKTESFEEMGRRNIELVFELLQSR